MTLRPNVRLKSSRRGGNQCVLWTQQDTSVVYITFYTSTEVVVSKHEGGDVFRSTQLEPAEHHGGSGDTGDTRVVAVKQAV